MVGEWYARDTTEMEGCKVIGKDFVLLCGLVIVAFAILVRVSVGLGGYSGELCEIRFSARDVVCRSWQTTNVRRLRSTKTLDGNYYKCSSK